MDKKTIREKIAFKESLKSFCITALTKRVDTILEAMKSSQESANNETKSSAGDKHETGRAMSQLENEMNGKQLLEINTELNAVQQVDVSKINLQAINGSVIQCKHATFFILAGIGVQTVDTNKVVFLSPKAPLALRLKEAKPGEKFDFNKIKFEVLEVF
jgi:transcription elongation GreA/GreB family factor